MVRLALPALLLSLALTGCSGEKDAQKSAPLTIDQQIKNIENSRDMPDDVKAKTIEGLRQQQAAAARSTR